jgi:cell division septum initiation protein DivIVA
MVADSRRKEAGPIDILHLLDRLEDTIRSGWHMPGTSRCMVDEAELQEIIESIRESIPEQIRKAEEVTRGRDDMLSESKAEAERLIAAAQAQALELVQEQPLYRTAEREARRIIEEANQQALEIRARADEYAVGSLESLERQLLSTLGTVRNGITSLRSEAVTSE